MILSGEPMFQTSRQQASTTISAQSQLPISSLKTSVTTVTPLEIPSTLPYTFPPWSISPSPLLNTSKSNTNTAAIVGVIVGGSVLLVIVAVALFILRRRFSLPWKKNNGRWHDMESRRVGETALPNGPDPYHDMKVVAPSVQDHITHVAQSEGIKPSESIFPTLAQLSKVHDSCHSSPFNPFVDPVVTGDHKRFPSHMRVKGINYIEMAPNLSYVSQSDSLSR
jgi:hypothetical protein